MIYLIIIYLIIKNKPHDNTPHCEMYYPRINVHLT